jgi:cob(I)alamin adenosyltransferase
MMHTSKELIGFDLNKQRMDLAQHLHGTPEAEHVEKLMDLAFEQLFSADIDLTMAMRELGVKELTGLLHERIAFLLFWAEMKRQEPPMTLTFSQYEVKEFYLTLKTCRAFVRQAGDHRG